MWRFEWIARGVGNISPDLAERWDHSFEESGNIWQCREFILAWENIVAPRRKETPILLLAQDDLGHEPVYQIYVLLYSGVVPVRSPKNQFSVNQANSSPTSRFDRYLKPGVYRRVGSSPAGADKAQQWKKTRIWKFIVGPT